MLYIEYEQFKRLYRERQERYSEILREKERLFEKTQPKAVRFDRDIVSGGKSVNLFEEYVMAKEKTWVDERLKECRSILEDRRRLLELKEAELRASKEIHDRVYVLRMIERKRIDRICRTVSYSRTQVFRILDEIRTNLKVGT